MRMTCSCKATLCAITIQSTSIYTNLLQWSAAPRLFTQALSPSAASQPTESVPVMKVKKTSEFPWWTPWKCIGLFRLFKLSNFGNIQLQLLYQNFHNTNTINTWKLDDQPCECDSWGQQRDSRLGASKRGMLARWPNMLGWYRLKFRFCN